MPVIHNRGKRNGDKTVARKIIFPKSWDANGHPAKEGKVIINDILLPGAHKTVTDEQFAHLKALFPDEIVNVDDIKDMQAQFPAAAAPKPREGYVAPEDVDALVAKKVAEKLAESGSVETRAQFIERLDKMDRADMISLIETEKLEIEHGKYKNPSALKSAILTAIENKFAAKSAA